MNQPRNVRLSQRQKRGLWLLGAITAAIAIPIGYLGVSGLHNEWRLGEHGQTIRAEVTNRRSNGNDLQVKYRFQVDGKVVRASDETGGTDLWESVTAEQWDLAKSTGYVQITYLPEDPNVNRPSSAEVENHPVGNKIAALFISALALTLFGAAARGAFKVARTKLWQFVAVDADGWEIECDAERRHLQPDDVRSAVLLVLPEVPVPAPWRFETDVLKLRLQLDEVTVPATSNSLLHAALNQLRSRGILKTMASK